MAPETASFGRLRTTEVVRAGWPVSLKLTKTTKTA